MTLADRIVVLNAGKIEQVGKPLELYHNPANRFVAGFIGSPAMNFITANVEASGSKTKIKTSSGKSTILSYPIMRPSIQLAIMHRQMPGLNI